MYELIGKQWHQMHSCFIGRTDNAIKNRWHIIQRNNFADHLNRSLYQESPLSSIPVNIVPHSSSSITSEVSIPSMRQKRDFDQSDHGYGSNYNSSTNDNGSDTNSVNSGGNYSGTSTSTRAVRARSSPTLPSAPTHVEGRSNSEGDSFMHPAPQYGLAPLPEHEPLNFFSFAAAAAIQNNNNNYNHEVRSSSGSLSEQRTTTPAPFLSIKNPNDIYFDDLLADMADLCNLPEPEPSQSSASHSTSIKEVHTGAVWSDHWNNLSNTNLNSSLPNH
jgi:hypothetical protein